MVVIVLGLLLLMVLFSQCSSKDGKPRSASPPAKATAAVATSAPSPAQKQALAANLARKLEDTGTPVPARIATAQILLRDHAGTPEAKRAGELLPRLQAEQAEAERGRQWNYGSYEDDMSSKTVTTASVYSTNSFEFDFPYQGRQHARLTLRRHPRWGNDVMFAIEKGQLLCHTYNCNVRVRFDDAPAQTFTGNEPEDNSSEMIFIPAYGTFAKKLPQAKKVRIEVAVYQHGSLVAEFDVDGFKPEKLNPAAK